MNIFTICELWIPARCYQRLLCTAHRLLWMNSRQKRGLAKLQENYTGQVYKADMAGDHLAAWPMSKKIQNDSQFEWKELEKKVCNQYGGLIAQSKAWQWLEPLVWAICKTINEALLLRPRRSDFVAKKSQTGLNRSRKKTIKCLSHRVFFKQKKSL